VWERPCLFHAAWLFSFLFLAFIERNPSESGGEPCEGAAPPFRETTKSQWIKRLLVMVDIPDRPERKAQWVYWIEGVGNC
jgi:hypothetical protein